MSQKSNTKTEIRRNQYKYAMNVVEEGRWRREENMVGIRKSKREESLMKKRRETVQDISDLVNKRLVSLRDMVDGLRFSDDLALQLKTTTELGKLLSIERNPPIDEVVDSGIVPWLVDFLNEEDCPRIQFEAAWALTNIASGTTHHTKVVIGYNVVPSFIYLLAYSPDDNVREQAVWALGNIAGDTPKHRDYVLSCGALAPMLNQLNEHTQLSIVRVITWTLSNLCRSRKVKLVPLQALERLIHSTDEQVLKDACWALSYLFDGTNERIQSIIEAGVVPRLVELLHHPSEYVIIPALRIIGNIVNGDDLQTQCVVSSGALPCLGNLLTQNYKMIIKKEACWTISNIIAGTREQIQMVIEANLIAPLVNLLQNAEFDIKKEAAWAISNVASNGSHDQIKYLVEQGCIKPLCDLLICLDPKIIIVCLRGLENILKVGEAEKNLGNTRDMNYYAQLIDDAKGQEKMDDLQNHMNSEIYEKAVKIMKTYWLEEEDEETQQPLGVDGSHVRFQFGAKQAPGGFKFNFN